MQHADHLLLPAATRASSGRRLRRPSLCSQRPLPRLVQSPLPIVRSAAHAIQQVAPLQVVQVVLPRFVLCSIVNEDGKTIICIRFILELSTITVKRLLIEIEGTDPGGKTQVKAPFHPRMLEQGHLFERRCLEVGRSQVSCSASLGVVSAVSEDARGRTIVEHE